MDDKVISLSGRPVGIPERSEAVLEILREVLERAEAGEVVGVAVVMLHSDGLSSYQFGGRVGGYGMLGAMAVCQNGIRRIVEDE